MADEGEAGIWYPTVEDVLLIHEDVISEDPDAVSGVQDESRVQFAIDFVKGHLAEEPSTIHERAFHLMRLIASNHWFADGNKRTALNVTELFYLVNGYEFDYGDDFRSILRLFSVREDLIDRSVGPEYFRDATTELVIDVEELDAGGQIAALLLALIQRYSDGNPDDLPSDLDADRDSIRDELGLTTEYDATINTDPDESVGSDGG
jgi:death-on-curing protein